MTKNQLKQHLDRLACWDEFASRTPCRVSNEIIRRLATAKDISEPTRTTLIRQYVMDLTDNETTLENLATAQQAYRINPANR